jgi:hypothetical protein
MDDVGIPAPRPEPETVTGHAITARFPGDCSACGLAVHEGQRIVPTSRGRWIHERCRP